MIITKEQQATMLEAARPLMKWLSDNGHPHCRVIVDLVNIELVEGIARCGTLDYVKD